MYRLPYSTGPLNFPDDFHTTPEGLLAIGGNLLPETVINAYTKGIFPWYSAGEPILWWHPDPRLVLIPQKIHISKKMQQWLKSGFHRVTFNQDFKRIMRECADKRGKNRETTWILPEIMTAYTKLAHLGYAQSVEVWNRKNELVGGLYGVTLGKIFFGESMFSHEDNASKVALICLCQELTRLDYELIDCQVRTEHLISMGAEEISRVHFLQAIQKAGADQKKAGARILLLDW